MFVKTNKVELQNLSAPQEQNQENKSAQLRNSSFIGHEWDDDMRFKFSGGALFLPTFNRRHQNNLHSMNTEKGKLENEDWSECAVISKEAKS